MDKFDLFERPSRQATLVRQRGMRVLDTEGGLLDEKELFRVRQSASEASVRDSPSPWWMNTRPAHAPTFAAGEPVPAGHLAATAEESASGTWVVFSGRIALTAVSLRSTTRR